MKTVLIILLSLAFVGAACGDSDDAPVAAGDSSSEAASDTTAPMTAAAVPETTEAMDDTAEESSVPTRIVSLSPTGTEMLFAIGAGDQVIAVDSFSYYPPEAPVTDLSAWQPNIEAIAEFEPDLVLASDGTAQEELEALGISVLVQFAAATIDDVYAQLAELGVVTGHEDEAAALAAQMRADIESILAEVPDFDEPPTYYHELDDTFFSVTSGTFIGQVYAMAGLVNAADPADEDGSAFGYPQLSPEFIFDADPDFIFLADGVCCGQTPEVVAERPGWDALSAVENGRVIPVDEDIASRWGPRIVDYLRVVVAALSTADAA